MENAKTSVLIIKLLNPGIFAKTIVQILDVIAVNNPINHYVFLVNQNTLYILLHQKNAYQNLNVEEAISINSFKMDHKFAQAVLPIA